MGRNQHNAGLHYVRFTHDYERDELKKYDSMVRAKNEENGTSSLLDTFEIIAENEAGKKYVLRGKEAYLLCQEAIHELITGWKFEKKTKREKKQRKKIADNKDASCKKSMSREEAHEQWIKMKMSLGMRGVENKYRGWIICPICNKKLNNYLCEFCGFTNAPKEELFPELRASKPSTRRKKISYTHIDAENKKRKLEKRRKNSIGNQYP